MAAISLRITEFDEAGLEKATYVQSPEGSTERSRVDVISLWQQAFDVFMPVGFPNSVTHDYLEYQIYDSLQAFSSSIASLLASRAVLSSVGVGDADASPTAAILLSIFQTSAGRLATILFAHRLGTSLGPECKMYRLLADILNDTGFLLDMISVAFPKPISVIILSFSSILRSLCGVAAGSAKASLSAHFARWGNLAELNAKDSSQETVISLLGMWAGSVVISYITEPTAAWTTLIVLLAIHLETNRRAVRAVTMQTLNRQRATLMFHHLQRGHVPTPVEIASQERIFERDGVLRGNDDRILGHCAVGASTERLLKAVSGAQTSTKAFPSQGPAMQSILTVYEKSPYILWQDRRSLPGRSSLFIVLKKGATPPEMLTAWWQALAVASANNIKKSTQPDQYAELELMRSTMDQAANLLKQHENALKEKGWDLDSGALETVSACRIVIGA
ncbi:hypothetical protein DOTSEDRAFT_130464 [Dothistroma septosporum NZE10]|uniref:Protein root UVB sensitive/RUS domain-containing protein n=1 Tax=Dothistroma septosporum (strain NZE10 / CBS 128990) TaxID=675120 RepID=N1PQW5_DOTSN|nr:hypothetical protein DOTSEDRAFT_130464 [Dothistroma septosporum NZE10]